MQRSSVDRLPMPHCGQSVSPSEEAANGEFAGRLQGTALPAEDHERRDHPETGNENQREELLRLIHGECLRRVCRGHDRPSSVSLGSAPLAGKGVGPQA